MKRFKIMALSFITMSTLILTSVPAFATNLAISPKEQQQITSLVAPIASPTANSKGLPGLRPLSEVPAAPPTVNPKGLSGLRPLSGVPAAPPTVNPKGLPGLRPLSGVPAAPPTVNPKGSPAQQSLSTVPTTSQIDATYAATASSAEAITPPQHQGVDHALEQINYTQKMIQEMAQAAQALASKQASASK